MSSLRSHSKRPPKRILLPVRSLSDIRLIDLQASAGIAHRDSVSSDPPSPNVRTSRAPSAGTGAWRYTSSIPRL